MNLEEEFRRQVEIGDWINTNFRISVPADRRSMIAHSCFDLAIEYHAAICVLFNEKLYGSMYALLRCIFEAHVRGLFFRHCASEIEMDQFQKDSLKIEFKDLIARIETVIENQNSALSKLKNSSWKILNSFTHSGYQHLVRRNANGITGPVNYDEGELQQSLQLAGSFALLSATELASLAQEAKLLKSVFKKMKAYSSP